MNEPDLHEESISYDIQRRTNAASDVVLAIWRERKFVVKGALVGLVVAVVLALAIRPKYESVATLMPPEKQAGSGLAMLAGMADDKLAAVASDALGMKSNGATLVGVLRSDKLQDRLIDKFDLRHVYRVKLREDAQEVLAKNTSILEDKKTGIITVAVTDRSPDRAASLARSYVDNLNEVLAELNTSAAHRERVFLEQRLSTVKQDLATASSRLSEFSRNNMAIDPKEQGKAMFDAAAKLRAEVSAAEAELSGLEEIYRPGNVRVIAACARIASLKRQLAKIEGSGAAAVSSAQASPDAAKVGGGLPPITSLPAIGVGYYDLYRNVKVQEAVFEVLTKQYELAKVQEARELPTVRILDEPKVPERKKSPRRTLMAISGLLLGAIFASLFLAARSTVLMLPPDHAVRSGIFELRGGLAADFRDFGDRIRLRMRLKVPDRVSQDHNEAKQD